MSKKYTVINIDIGKNFSNDHTTIFEKTGLLIVVNQRTLYQSMKMKKN